jgi:hypothetical protein
MAAKQPKARTADTIDANLRTINRGQIASALRGELQGYLLDAEEKVVSRLVGQHRNQTLTNDSLRGSIGEIAALRDLQSQLESDIKRGLAAREEELVHGNSTD